jgi:hypothetical protein
MKTAKEIYHEEAKDFNEDDDWFCISDYQPILNSFGTIVCQEDEKNWQGDSFVLYHDEENNEFGYLSFGWGSCSGCDALQACRKWEDVDDLMLELQNSITWFASADDAIGFFETHDWEGEYSFNSEAKKLFLIDAMAYLNNFIKKDCVGEE